MILKVRIAPVFMLRMIIINITFIKVQTIPMDTDEERKQRLRKEGTLHPNPDRVKADLLAKFPFFDAHDLMQMKYEMLRSVTVDQQSVVEAANTFGLSRVAYYHAWKQYQSHGLAGLLPYRRGPRHPHKFTPEVMSFIDEQLAAIEGSPDWGLVSKQIEERFGTKVHPRSVERAVKQKRGPSNDGKTWVQCLRSHSPQAHL
jgi:transposase